MREKWFIVAFLLVSVFYIGYVIEVNKPHIIAVSSGIAKRFSLDAIPPGTAMSIYGVYADDWQQLYQKCQKSFRKDRPFVLGITMSYESKRPGLTLYNTELEMRVRTCEDIPRRSVCLEGGNDCFIKYRLEQK